MGTISRIDRPTRCLTVPTSDRRKFESPPLSGLVSPMSHRRRRVFPEIWRTQTKALTPVGTEPDPDDFPTWTEPTE